jgi:molecular chaperone GrpE
MTEDKKKHTPKTQVEAEKSETPTQEEKSQPVEAAAEEETVQKIDPTTELKAELEKSNQQAREYLDLLQRERADFTNYKRRVERDQCQLKQNVAADLIKKYLVVMDDMARALKNKPAEGEAAAWADGFDLIYRKLQNILEAEGITAMNCENELFDPTRHEAITQEESTTHQSGQIIEVVQQGFMLGERVIRPALVRVAR